jgi:hypothetical protein
MFVYMKTFQRMDLSTSYQRGESDIERERERERQKERESDSTLVTL